LREIIENMDVPTPEGKITHLTVSVGVNTRIQGQGGNIDKFIDWADMALYAAKNKGRNRVCFFELPTETKNGDPDEVKENIIFVVDDNETSLTAAENALVNDYRVIALSSAAKMFEALTKFIPDLILLDIKMPDMSGYEALERLKGNDSYADIPVIFLSGLSDAISEAHGIELGAVDFIMKPFTEPVLLNRIKKHLEIDEQVRERTRQLALRTEQLARRSEELLRLQNGIVYTLADIVESRDPNTGGHIERTTRYIRILIDEMIERGVYSDELKSWDLDSVVSSARLHDIGKISIPDSILNKPGKLTEEEFKIIKTHTDVGARLIDQMTEQTGDAAFLRSAKIFAAFHHEKWNGSGYPNCLHGTDIPLHGRIMAIVDVYDALVSDRPYKKAFPHEKALEIIMDDAGNHFDPHITEVFNAVNLRIKAVRDRFS
jgi:putative two-component system response regulator